MTDEQKPRRVAVLVEDEFEDSEVTGPVELLQAAGLEVVLVGPLLGHTYTGQERHDGGR